MKYKSFASLTCVGFFLLLATISTFAQGSVSPVLSGYFNDHTPASNVSGPWEVRGDWSLTVKEHGTKADFSAALTMERSDLGVTLNNGSLDNPASRNAHTHHISMVNATVTPLTGNGFRLTGPATITGNGNFPPPFGPNTSLQVDVIGGNALV
ncbi:MAG TPA: hypothetical protein VE779_06285, partial [Candidatus Angelobacter sp.]|nr:hypothetical protein [Candidatus Angelobacter sp.]